MNAVAPSGRLALALRGLYGMVDLTPLEATAVTHPSASSTPPPLDRLALALLDGGARVLQLRIKGADAGLLLAAVEALRPLCRRRGALLIVNDRLDVALAGDADGVHLGQDDLPLDAARRLAPPGFIIGISTHDLAQARAAAAGGADYIGFGPVFPTSTKDNPDPVVGTGGLAAACAAVAIPVVAIGGITLERAPDVARAGAAAAAVISAVNRAPDVARAARAVAAAFVPAPVVPVVASNPNVPVVASVPPAPVDLPERDAPLPARASAASRSAPGDTSGENR